ncbi:Rlf2p KNAG_0G01150 [Huiozyma naganishii CBS 8797]|uniref:Uncharacterized protein n=1 Tax=Huiozyma naganishii (strain ATCC MYA-139 / BCRC 22969 / CBS 8797 / KCTC 17520 / NBRC 10181 / NCYC 3082 / Yp74L-3) TaxID=1071383 RepID=J7RNN1_HUIN7|nr:hypothetical protein KNAG_0G01150 [Kazachstania naganishii CBS 8797]CCK71173.1 hypothetical protein KNAG_0G01150 [Kazachstania naganishii CBS 8797]
MKTGEKGKPSKSKGILSFFQNVSSSTKLKTNKVKSAHCAERCTPEYNVVDLEENSDDSLREIKRTDTAEEVKKEPVEELSSRAIEVGNVDVKDGEGVDETGTQENVADEKPVDETKRMKALEKENDKRKREEAKKLKAEEKLRIKREAEEQQLKIKREKEAERIRLKQQREEEKLKLKQQKEEERLKLKKQREEEKLKLKQQKEEEKQKREAEKQRKEEQRKEKELARERAQSRIGSFFEKVRDSSSAKHEKSDYEKYFLPFFARYHVRMPTCAAISTLNAHELDSLLSPKIDQNDDHQLMEWLESKRTKRGHPIKYKAVSLLQQMTSKEKTDEELQQLLNLIPQKFIKFYENVRPPFVGTYSKDVVLPVNNPCSKENTGYNYDYDTDLEWVNEEAEDGDSADVENLESGEDDDDEDEEDDDESENEFDGFLDQEDTSGQSSKKKFIGPLIPTIHLLSQRDELHEEADRGYFDDVAVQYLIATMPFPINPLQSVSRAANGCTKRALEEGDGLPLGEASNLAEAKKPKSLITTQADLLMLFNEVNESTFSLSTVTEIAQKRLSSYSKQTIKNTVKEYAIRSSGKSDGDRKWQIKDIAHWEQLKQVNGA